MILGGGVNCYINIYIYVYCIQNYKFYLYFLYGHTFGNDFRLCLAFFSDEPAFGRNIMYLHMQHTNSMNVQMHTAVAQMHICINCKSFRICIGICI